NLEGLFEMALLTILREMIREKQLRSLHRHVAELADAALDLGLGKRSFTIDEARRQQLYMLREQWELQPEHYLSAALTEVLVRFLNKIDKGETAVYRIIGQRALTALARVVHLVSRDDEIIDAASGRDGIVI